MEAWTLLLKSVDDLVDRRLPAVRRHRLLAYGLAITFFAAAFAIRWLVHEDFGNRYVFSTFFIAIVLSAFMGGAGPGLMTLVLSAVSAWLVFMPTRPVTNELPPIEFGLLVLCGISLFLIAIVQLSNRTVDRLLAESKRGEELLHQSARSEMQLEVLNSELGHRIKNLFSIVNSLVSQAARSTDSTSVMASALHGRLAAMAAALDLLVTQRFRGTELGELVARTLEPLAPTVAGRFQTRGDPMVLRSETATPLALVLHELATNAVKHGAWSNETGVVALNWHVTPSADSHHIEIIWQERGGPRVSEPTRTGVGSALIERAVPGAIVERRFEPEGLTCKISLQATPMTRPPINSRSVEPARRLPEMTSA